MLKLKYNIKIKMNITEIRERYLEFMKEKGHNIVLSASLVPENDATTLFVSAGMQPMINYLLGEKYSNGNRVSNSQKCFRSQDIDEIGDNRHTTFFEMLGNWSFGDYFKKEQINWIFEFLTNKEKGLGLDKKNLFFTCYIGNKNLNIDKDIDSKNLWIENGINENKIFFYDEKKNWWSRAGVPENMPEGEIGGPDTEIFYDFDNNLTKKIHENSIYKNDICHPNCDCGRFLEICNSVFIQYKKENNSIKELSQKNVDFGGGLARLAAAINNNEDIFNLNIFDEAKKIIFNMSKIDYFEDKKNYRIILDHIQAATFLIGDGVLPGNKDREYFVRRLIRRSLVSAHKLNIKDSFLRKISETFINYYKDSENYLGNNLSKNKEKILEEIEKEENKFKKTLSQGLKEFEKINITNNLLSGEKIFNLFQTYGFPVEIIEEIAKEKNLLLDINTFLILKKEHSEKSKTASQGMFKGGLVDNSEMTTALHTSSHLMLAAMKKLIDKNIHQEGSNINSERLRFDFNFERKLNDEELSNIESYVNNAIKNGFEIEIEEMGKEIAKNQNITGSFWEKYPDIVKVYNIKGKNNEIYSRELCGGPHVKNSKDFLESKTFKVIKEESVSFGIRRIKAVLK